MKLRRRDAGRGASTWKGDERKMEAYRAYSFMMTVLGQILLLPWTLYKGIVWCCKASYRAMVKPCNCLRETCCEPVNRALCAPGGCLFWIKESCVDCCDSCRDRTCPRHDRGDWGSGIGGPPGATASGSGSAGFIP